MPWVRFTRDYLWRPRGEGKSPVLRFLKGSEKLVPTPCAEAATKDGAAEAIERPLSLDNRASIGRKLEP